MKVDDIDSVQADALLSTKDILKDRLLGQGRWEHMGVLDLCSAFRFFKESLHYLQAMQIAIGWLIWAALKPILKLVILLFIGAYLARIKLVTPIISKVLSKFLLLFPYPCLFFTSIVNSIKPENIGKMGILIFMSVAFLFIGHVIGVILCRILKPKKAFKNTLVMACSMGNCGDLPMAIILSIGNSEPFNNGDQAIGIAYISAFLLLTNLYFFTVGLSSIGSDIQVLMQEEKEKDRMELDSVGSSGAMVQVLHQRSTVSSSLPVSIPANEIDIQDDEGNDLRLTTVSLLGSSNSNSSSTSPWKELREKARVYFSSPTAQLWIQCIFSPCNTSVILGLIVALSPPLKELFVTFPPATSIQQQPPLSFLMEAMGLLANCSVVLGIVNLGAALGSLEIKQFLGWRLVGGIAFARLLIFPIFGISFTLIIQNCTLWIPETDLMLRFVIMLEAVVPTASSTVYFTQYWHPKGEAQEISGVVLVQYLVCGFTLTLSLIAILSLL